MSMPSQLARSDRRGKSEPRPLAEALPQIDVRNLRIPRDNQTYVGTDFRFPHINVMRINWAMVQFSHSNRVQTFRFKWIKTGFGYPRPALICECGRPVIK